MNTLSYGLLSLLAQSSYSGYDLMLRIQPFWPAKHSQIYPLLAKLEQEDYIRFELVPQRDKPDKKVYSLTGKGQEALKDWFDQPTAEPALRDEMMLKVFCMSYADRESARKMLADRLAYHKEQRRKYEHKLAELKEREGWPEAGLPAPSHPLFGAYLLTRKAIMSNETNTEWCKWVLSLLPEAD
ncbi:PadR family transcriptional regulator [Cohnella ginsengisoli]|uniref:PadR family transcriptional regulator n=1 Tax=Cohnella ginsengisoli TaxID=425004 RepID=A0A9X4QQ22_9BACL|nr:PadR family transcriptional regulator [Cohnella ginsengisoli]MDG0794107.1 PadR family transcriptional regulator [Cohnella ginsengisoli]